jgi:hypothetical protein
MVTCARSAPVLLSQRTNSRRLLPPCLALNNNFLPNKSLVSTVKPMSPLNRRSQQLKHARAASHTATTTSHSKSPLPKRGRPPAAAPTPASTVLDRTEKSLEALRNLSHNRKIDINRKKRKVETLTQNLGIARSTSSSYEDAYNSATDDLLALQARHKVVLDSLGTKTEHNAALEDELAKVHVTLITLNLELQTARETGCQVQKHCSELAASRNQYRKDAKKAQQQLNRTNGVHAAEQARRLVYHIKEKGQLSNTTFDTILELTRLDIPSRHIYRVFLVMANAFGIDLKGSFCQSSVLRTIDVGGYAGMVQIGEAMTKATSE